MASLVSTLPFFLLSFWALADESITTYTCGPDFQPTDIAFDENGVLYSTDGRWLDIYEGGVRSFTFISDTRPHFVYQHDADGCTPVLEENADIFGITAFQDGICFTRAKIELMTSEVEIVCLNEDAFSTYNDTALPTGFLRGLTAQDDKLWLLSGVLTPIEQQGGILLSFAKGKIVSQTRLALLPQFITVHEDGTLYLTLLRTDDAGVRSGKVAKVGPEHEVTELSPDFAFPTGILLVNDRLLVTDYRLGELQELSLDGELLGTYGGFEGPMGLAQAPNGDMCVAEMVARRIRCFPLELLRSQD